MSVFLVSLCVNLALISTARIQLRIYPLIWASICVLALAAIMMIAGWRLRQMARRHQARLEAMPRMTTIRLQQPGSSRAIGESETPRQHKVNESPSQLRRFLMLANSNKVTVHSLKVRAATSDDDIINRPQHATVDMSAIKTARAQRDSPSESLQASRSATPPSRVRTLGGDDTPRVRIDDMTRQSSDDNMISRRDETRRALFASEMKTQEDGGRSHVVAIAPNKVRLMCCVVMGYVTWDGWHVACGMWCVACGTRHAARGMVCDMWYVVCGMCYVLCGMWHVLCAYLCSCPIHISFMF